MSEATKIELDNGKYTYVFDNGKQYALRHGEPWRDLTGDKLVYWMGCEIQRLSAAAKELQETVDGLVFTNTYWKERSEAVRRKAEELLAENAVLKQKILGLFETNLGFCHDAMGQKAIDALETAIRDFLNEPKRQTQTPAHTQAPPTPK